MVVKTQHAHFPLPTLHPSTANTAPFHCQEVSLKYFGPHATVVYDMDRAVLTVCAMFSASMETQWFNY